MSSKKVASDLIPPSPSYVAWAFAHARLTGGTPVPRTTPLFEVDRFVNFFGTK
ncbi:MAG: hypothetical protein L0387_33315 [Acidobacteria bacterium]|nr:hypothetical protein [Acidobacteriota bacterium]